MRGGDKNNCEKARQLSFTPARDDKIEIVESEVNRPLF